MNDRDRLSLHRRRSHCVATGRIGAVAWLVGAAQFLIAQLVVGAGWTTRYSWATNNISDLGNVGCGNWDESRPRYVCSPLHAVMNVSFIAQGVLLLVGVLLTGAFWGRTAMSWAARVLLAVGAAGWVVVGLVPADVDENLHLLGALLIMGLGNIGLVCAGFLPRTTSFGRIRPVTRAFAAVAVLSAVMFFPGYGPLIGTGGMERLAAFAVTAWTVIAAITALGRMPVGTPS
ncbi:hypothetical protein CRH09_10430 [Nocardia terpenica]|uniref:DUF998 domain-containing protein n=1 Tax=Nocardia terpenica TaxID=455432 RepID=A0A291RHK6_9NOCA|nr:hypothetical protein CRH09_10430 [Nocardia terpenica]